MIDKIEQYISSRKIYNRNCYQMTLEELRELKELSGESAMAALCLAFNYGRAKGLAGGPGRAEDSGMSEMQIFSSARFGTIRTTEINGQPWFCLADVCKPLGLQSYHCKDRLKSDGLVSTEGTDSMGRTQMMTFIDEGNLYRTIFQSKAGSGAVYFVGHGRSPSDPAQDGLLFHTPPGTGGVAGWIGRPDPRDTACYAGRRGARRRTWAIWSKASMRPLMPVPLSLEKQCPGQICIAGMMDVLPMQVPAVE